LAAFDGLARRYQDRVYSYALRIVGDPHEAADLAQDTLMRAFRSLASFDAKQRFGAWLFGIAAHVCRDCLRRRRRRLEHTSEAVEDAAAPVREGEGAAAAEERSRVRDAVRKLPIKYREVIVLHYLEEMGYDQVARSLGITAAAARRRALRAREMLRRRLGGG
jgi:RNA polymerase sigma-70 factor (ECF subfamily)